MPQPGSRAVLGELLRAAENRHARVAVLSAAPPTIIPKDSDIGGFRKFRTIGPFEVYAQSIADPSVSVDQSGSTEYAYDVAASSSSPRTAKAAGGTAS